MKKLIIVESPTKAKTIAKFLDDSFTIKASMGHIIDLPKTKLGIDIKKNFEPQFQVVSDKKKTINEIQKSSKIADEVILATDPDREGEAIAFHIQELLQKKRKQKSPFKRIVFHEITKEAIYHALENPRTIDTNLVNAQVARRVIDRLVGYKLSPLLRRKIRKGLSAGRVQSVALRLIVERQKEIEQFNKKSYWTISAIFQLEKQVLEPEFVLVDIDDKKIELSEELMLYAGSYKVSLTAIQTEEQAQELKSDIEQGVFRVADHISKQVKRSPYAPFTTSVLQQDASRRFGFSAKRTMAVAQKLYEEGYITYHRTDSVSMSTNAVMTIRAYIEKEFGKKYLRATPRLYKTKQKLAQEAHECIRPTDVKRKGTDIEQLQGSDAGKLYHLIWSRAIASQMADAIINATTIYVKGKGVSTRTYGFKTSGSVINFEGYLRLMPSGLESIILPTLKVGEALTIKRVNSIAHQTTPPPKYNDASLIGTLEEKGIGRPSTYASTISTIEQRLYVEREEKRFKPTIIGTVVSDFLVKNFASIDDIPFTSKIEDELDEIAKGKKSLTPVLNAFYTPFNTTLEKVDKTERVELDLEETGEICPLCGAPLVIQLGKYGKFISCKNFPQCTFKKNFVITTEYLCPKDQGKIIMRKTKKGRTFYGCNNYPTCTFAVWKLTDIAPQQT